MKDDSLSSCRAGIARTALRCGDVRKGLGVARELGQQGAEILEQMKQLSEAAVLYESAQYYDKAVHLYIKLKNWTKISLSPALSEVVFAGLERERLSDCSAEHDPGGAEAGDGAGVVPGVGLSKAACLLIILGPSPKIKIALG